jgi:hypothetical protein
LISEFECDLSKGQNLRPNIGGCVICDSILKSGKGFEDQAERKKNEKDTAGK